MSALGLGLTAANAYFNEGERQEKLQRDRERYDAEKQRTQSELSLLSDKADAERSGYQLRGKENKSNLGLVDPRANATRTGLELTTATNQAELDAGNPQARANLTSTSLANQQDDQYTLGMTNAARRGTAINTANAQNNESKVAEALSRAKADEIPNTVAQFVAQGVLSRDQAQTQIAAQIHSAIMRKDPGGIVALVNAQKKLNPALANIPDAAAVDLAADGKGNQYLVLKDGKGNVIKQAPVQAFHDAYKSLQKPVSNEFKTVGNNAFSFNPTTGTATQLVQGGPDMQHQSADLQMINYFKTSGLAKSDQEAFGMLQAYRNSADETSFVKKVMESNPFSMSDPAGTAQQARAAYQAIKGGGQPQSNTSQPGTVDPKVMNLLGIPIP